MLRCTSADFSKNGIGPAGISRLVEVLKSNTGLQTLTLDTNNCGDEGVEEIARYMSSDTHISVLNLSGNNIGDKGAVQLAEMLKVGFWYQNITCKNAWKG